MKDEKPIGMKRERLDELKVQKAEAKKQIAGKEWSKLSAKQKDALLETVCRMLGIID